MRGGAAGPRSRAMAPARGIKTATVMVVPVWRAARVPVAAQLA
jgi:hypothetical protein